MRGVGRAPALAGVASAGGCFGWNMDDQFGVARRLITRFQARQRSAPSNTLIRLGAVRCAQGTSHLLPQGEKEERSNFRLRQSPSVEERSGCFLVGKNRALSQNPICLKWLSILNYFHSRACAAERRSLARNGANGSRMFLDGTSTTMSRVATAGRAG